MPAPAGEGGVRSGAVLKTILDLSFTVPICPLAPERLSPNPHPSTLRRRPCHDASRQEARRKNF
nr:MAG TPA: hypothetical protein [Caudoviricetes sp.]